MRQECMMAVGADSQMSWVLIKPFIRISVLEQRPMIPLILIIGSAHAYDTEGIITGQDTQTYPSNNDQILLRFAP